MLLEGEQPGRIQEGFVEKLIASEIDGALVLPKAPVSFAVGDAVTIEGGVFHGCKGLYQGQTSKQREIVLLESLGRVELATGFLR